MQRARAGGFGFFIQLVIRLCLIYADTSERSEPPDSTEQWCAVSNEQTRAFQATSYTLCHTAHSRHLDSGEVEKLHWLCAVSIYMDIKFCPNFTFSQLLSSIDVLEYLLTALIFLDQTLDFTWCIHSRSTTCTYTGILKTPCTCVNVARGVDNHHATITKMPSTIFQLATT
jgi:hypothetical protein